MSIVRMTDLDLSGKRVLIRQDLNVPIDNGQITSEQRITASVPTIKLALEKGVELRLLSSMQPGEGTAVGYLGDNERPPLAGLALRGREITLIGREAPPLLRRMLEALENNGIAVEQSALLRDGVRLSVSPEQGRRALNVLHDLCFG